MRIRVCFLLTWFGVPSPFSIPKLYKTKKMKTLYEVKIKYCIPDLEKDGMVKWLNGIMLVDALSFGDAEKTAMAVAGSYSREQVTISGINVSAAQMVIDTDKEKWYMVSYTTLELDERGNVLKRKYKTIVCADDIDDAKAVFDRSMGSTFDYDVTGIKEMKVTEHVKDVSERKHSGNGSKNEEYGNKETDCGLGVEHTRSEDIEEGSGRDSEGGGQRNGRSAEARRKRKG